MRRVLFLAGILGLSQYLGAVAEPGGEQLTKQVKIKAKRFKFSPSRIKVKAGTTLEIVLSSQDVRHGFKIVGSDIDVEIPARGKGQVKATFKTDKAGLYRFECSRVCGAGHASMRGVIQVTGPKNFGFQWKYQSQRSRVLKTGQQLESVVGTFMGDPISGITAEEFELFRLGLEDFLEVEDAAEGLGPVFNGRSCALCHSIPAIGGSGTVMETRAGILHEDGSFEEFPGGSNFQMFSLPIHSIQARVPPEANSVAHRKSLPLFGNGLVEAVPDETLIALEDPYDADLDGISGRAARILDRDSGEVRVGRFGWKAQQSSLFTFGAEAYRDEMGITNVLFPREACPYGVDCELLELIDPAPDPEDAPDITTGLRGVDNFANFLRLLGPPTRGEISQEVLLGEQIFRSLRCHSCHVESLETGPASSPALSFKRFFPYGDFLLHQLGTGDGIGQADAQPDEVRTAPLWGVRFRGPFLHDGRASNLSEAILMHGAEAEPVRVAFEALSDVQTRALLAFLKSL